MPPQQPSSPPFSWQQQQQQSHHHVYSRPANTPAWKQQQSHQSQSSYSPAPQSTGGGPQSAWQPSPDGNNVIGEVPLVPPQRPGGGTVGGMSCWNGMAPQGGGEYNHPNIVVTGGVGSPLSSPPSAVAAQQQAAWAAHHHHAVYYGSAWAQPPGGPVPAAPLGSQNTPVGFSPRGGAEQAQAHMQAQPQAQQALGQEQVQVQAQAGSFDGVVASAQQS